MKPLDEMMKRLLMIELKKNGYNEAEYDDDTRFITPDPRFPSIRYGQDGYMYNLHDSQYTKELAKGRFADIFHEVREAWEAWHYGRPMPEKSDEGYRALAETGDTLLAARDDGEYGLHFVVWDFTLERDGVRNGDYTSSYAAAKEEFVRRSSLVAKNRLLSPAELRLACHALWLLGSETDISNEASMCQKLISKLEDADPELVHHRPQTSYDTLKEGSEQRAWRITLGDGRNGSIPMVSYIELNQGWSANPLQNDAQAAKAAEEDGLRPIHDIPGLPAGVYIDTPANRSVIQQMMNEFPEYKHAAERQPAEMNEVRATPPATTKSIKPFAPIIGADGNIFNIMNIASQALRQAGQQDAAEEMSARIWKTESYAEALGVIQEYVSTSENAEMNNEPNMDMM